MQVSRVNILHIIDDKKFIDSCKATFEIGQNSNHYSSAKDFQHKLTEADYDLLVVHYMRSDCIRVLLNEDIKIPVVWFFWGADAFQLGKFHNQFLLPKTKRISIKLNFKKSISAGINGVVKWMYPGLIDKTRFYKDLIQAIKKVDFIVPVVPGDYSLLQRHYNFKGKLFHLNYVNAMVVESIKSVNGHNILLGNSASFTNNHLDIIDDLKNALNSRPDIKVIVPLNYGNKQYATYMNAKLEDKFGAQVYCLMDFLPIEEYDRILLSCNIMIMNHLRQQAVGNIIFGLIHGIHVYLQETSSTYAFLKNEGFCISRISEIQNIRALAKEEIETNRKLSVLVFGKEVQHNKVQRLIELALSEKLL